MIVIDLNLIYWNHVKSNILKFFKKNLLFII
jgi:hypothetical protein